MRRYPGDQRPVTDGPLAQYPQVYFSFPYSSSLIGASLSLEDLPYSLNVLHYISAPVTASESDGQITITRRGSQAANPASGQNYTGAVRLEQSFKTTGAAKLSGEPLGFEPGSRSNWHTNPLGQSILVTSGKMMVQEENGPY